MVYIAVVYDDTGNYSREGPPPPGTPVSLHGMARGRAGGREVGQGRQGHRDLRRFEPDVARRAGLAAFFAAGQLSSRPSRRSASSPTAIA